MKWKERLCLNMSKHCKYCGKDLPDNCRHSACKSCRDTHKSRSEKVVAAVGAAVLAVGSVALKLLFKK